MAGCVVGCEVGCVAGCVTGCVCWVEGLGVWLGGEAGCEVGG